MVRLLIKVKPGASRDEISVDSGNNVSIRIKAKPIDGEANEYLVNYLAKEFAFSRSKVQIVKGATSRMKQVVINIEQPELERILAKYKL